jgi:hypothetical protein
MRLIECTSIGFCLLVGSFASAQQTKPDAQPAERPTPKAEFPLTPKNGPWMVMVKSFQGPEAVEYANRLARELRERHKIAAYTFVRKSDQPVVQQAGYVRGHAREYVSAGVIAGDCKNEKAASKLQDEIQKIRPNAITQDMVPNYQWTAGPLRTAFCMPNPLAPAAPAAKPEQSMAKFNSGPNSIYRNTSEYTLELALFTGGIAFTKKEAEKLEKNSLLEAAGEHAEQVASQLRRMGYDAYTYHALTYSLVAVGSFSSPDDPQVQQLAQQLAATKVGPFTMSPSPRLMKVPKN